MMKRIKSGIPGLDELIGGGFIKGSANLITGKTGSGKTLFSLQLLYMGAKYYKEPGLFITTEQSAEDLKYDLRESFGWDLDELEKAGLITFVELNPYDIKKLPLMVDKILKYCKYSRVVIDSESMFGLYLQNPYEERSIMFDLLRKFKGCGMTIFLTSEILEESKGLSRFGVIEFLADCVILLNFLMFASKYNRVIAVRKMRRTKHNEFLHPLVFTPNGITVERIRDGSNS